MMQPLPDLSLSLLLLLLPIGLAIGSFLNVVIHRLPRILYARWRREAVALLAETDSPSSPSPDSSSSPFPYGSSLLALAYPSSHCPHCRTPLRWYDNIPLLSWLLLRGRCRSCHHAISLRYPLVELLAAVALFISLVRFSLTPQALFAALFLCTLLTLAAIDWETQLLPDQLTQPLLWLGLLLNHSNLFAPLADAVLGAAIGYLLLWSLYWLFKLLTGKEGMGYGDFKLLAALGAWLGWSALPTILLIGAGAGAAFGLLLRLTGRLASGQPFPFGPFLALGGSVALFSPTAAFALFP
ncbi:MAG: prepilin peptidase [Hydrogenophilus sp.]|nr:prepilin peptidase [Hydrogenophilus sp.]